MPVGQLSRRYAACSDGYIVYAADRLNIEIDWGKVLSYLTRDRQLVRATAYAPVSDDPRHRLDFRRRGGHATARGRRRQSRASSPGTCSVSRNSF
jgi:hypothetical protein